MSQTNAAIKKTTTKFYCEDLALVIALYFYLDKIIKKNKTYKTMIAL